MNVFSKALGDNSLERFEQYKEKFSLLCEILKEENKKYNLTAIEDDEGIAYRHFADCLMLEKYIPEGAKVLDVGAGGGFPTLPIAAVRPDITVFSLDATAKKVAFIEKAANALSLSNVRGICARAEEAARGELRESFDFVTSRAVARLNILCEWCIPFLKTGGTFAAMKGISANEEYTEAKNAFSVLGCKAYIENYDFYSPEKSTLGIVFARKLVPTDEKYPLNNSQIKKKPL